MFKRVNVLLTLLLWITCAGPAWALPALSGHHPTLAAPTGPHTTGLLKELGLGLGVIAGTTISVKPTADIAAKFVTRAQAAAPEYGKGVQGAGAKWMANALASEPNYVAGVQDAASKGRFGKGIQKHGSTKFQTNASTLGTQRYGPGVANAQGAYAAGVEPYLTVLKGLDLPARGPKGSPANMNRANVVATALRKAKVGG